jgi:hypothetical protein
MTKNKEFDAVELMRKLRSELNEKIEGMNYEEQRRYLDEHKPTDSNLRRLMEQRRTVQSQNS